MCCEGRPGAQALCGCGDWIGSQFCYRFIFQTLKGFKAPQIWFRSLQTVLQGVSLASREGGEKENLFKWDCLLSSCVPWGSAEQWERGARHSPGTAPSSGTAWSPLTIDQEPPHALCFKNIHHRVPCLGLSWMWMDFPRQLPAWSLGRGTGDTTDLWPEEEGSGATELCCRAWVASDSVIWIPFLPLIFWLSEGRMWNLWWIKPPSWLQMLVAAPTPRSASSSSAHCAWGNIFFKVNLYCKIYKRQLRSFSLFS